MNEFEEHLLTTLRGTTSTVSSIQKPRPGEVIVIGIPEKNWPPQRQEKYARRLIDVFRTVFPDNQVLVVDKDINILLMQDPDACAMARDALCQERLTVPRSTV